MLVATGLFALARLWLPEIAAAAAAMPFLFIGGYAGWRRLRTPGTANIAELLGKLRAMSWENFSLVIAEAFRRDGYGVAEITGDFPDLELRKDGQITVVCCKRWKVAQTGIGPLRELHAAMRARDAHKCIYVSVGEFTDNAHGFAAQNGVRLVAGATLETLVARVARRRWRWFAR